MACSIEVCPPNRLHVEAEVLTSVNMQNVVFSDTATCK
jgi:hypothetical protein